MIALWLVVAVAAEPGWTIAEEPSWVVEQDVPEPASLRRERTDVQFLLDDLQVEVHETTERRYYRDVRRIGSVAGVQDNAEVDFAFDPSYETLILHHIELVRDGQVIDALVADELRVVQQERDMDMRIYNGQLQVLAFLNDVRVGDVLDRAWTIEGANPALKGHYLDVLRMGFEFPVARVHRVVRWPNHRELFLTQHQGAPKATIDASGDTTVYSWSLDGVRAHHWDGYAPGWLEQQPWVQLSDFVSWAEVVDWASPYYVPGELDPELQASIAEWKKQPDKRSQLQAALAFVQDDIRYLGIEMGPRGLIPHGVSETYGRRFGDCKDKSLLLVTALGEMGIEAHPALVHTRRHQGIEALHPTAFAFNHAIVRAKLDGQDLWLDATRSYERGDPAAMEVPAFRSALVIEPGGSELTDMTDPTPAEPQVTRVERFDVPELYGPVTLAVETSYRGRRASGVRRMFESEAAEDIRSSRLRGYAERLPGLTSDGPVQWVDDPETGLLTVSERYRVADGIWEDGNFALVAFEARNWLVDPPPGERPLPFEIAHPIHTRHTVEVHLPEDFAISGDLDSVKTDDFELTVDRTYGDRVLRLDVTYRSLRDHVPAKDVEAHRQAVSEAAALAVFWVWDGQIDPGMGAATKGALGGVALVLVLFVSGPAMRAWAAWRRKRGFDARLRREAADSPESAVLVEDTVQANRALKRMRCACGSPLDQGVPKSSNIRHNGAHILVLEAGCTSCEDRTARYFKFRA